MSFASIILITALLSFMPISELRGAIPFAIANDIPWYWAYLFTVILNILVAPVCWVFLATIHKLLYGTSSVPEKTSSVPEKTSSVPNEVSSVPDEPSSVPNEVSSVPDEPSSVPNEVSSVPEKTSSVPNETSSVPNGTSSVPDEHSSVPNGTSSVPDEPSSVPKKTSSVPEKTSSVPEKTSSVPNSASKSSAAWAGFRWYRSFFDRIVEKARKKLSKGVEKWGWLGISLFVAIPLPITGAWTGTIGAWVLGVSKKKTMLAVCIGVPIAGVIVTTVVMFGIEALNFFIKK